MAVHKARPDSKKLITPTQPGSTVMEHGRFAVPHAEIDGKPVLGGIQNAVVEGQTRSPEVEEEKVKQYHEQRDQRKEEQSKAFDKKTGGPKVTSEVKEDKVAEKQSAEKAVNPEPTKKEGNK